jgi:phage FluMu gp28-like protein
MGQREQAGPADLDRQEQAMYLPYQIVQALEDERLWMAERDRRTATLRRAYRETTKTRKQGHRLVRVLFPRTTG